MKTEMVELIRFLKVNRRNAWIKCCGFEIYVRVSYRLLDGRPTRCFDIGNINLPEDQRGNGKFKKLLCDIVTLLRDEKLRGDVEYILVESLVNTRLEKYLLGVGFSHTYKERVRSPSVYKKL